MRKNQAAFTLIEMLIVLMIISVLVLLMIPNLTGKTKEVNNKGCEALVAVVQGQVESYSLDNGSFPDSLIVLKEKDYITEDQLYCSKSNKQQLMYNKTTGKVTAPTNSNE